MKEVNDPNAISENLHVQCTYSEITNEAPTISRDFSVLAEDHRHRARKWLPRVWLGSVSQWGMSHLAGLISYICAHRPYLNLIQQYWLTHCPPTSSAKFICLQIRREAKCRRRCFLIFCSNLGCTDSRLRNVNQFCLQKLEGKVSLCKISSRRKNSTK